MASYKAPPELNDDKSFTDWKKEVEFWQIATDVKPEKQGAMIFLSLRGKSREAVRELSKDEISTATGVDEVIKKLDTLWKEDANLEAFNAYERFEKFKRPSNMSVNEYIVAFERLNNKLIATKTELPEGVLAYRLLKSAGLTEEQEQLSKATVQEFTYKAMCSKLKSIFGDSNHKQRECSETNEAIRQIPDVKNEQAMYLEETFYNNQRNYGPSNYTRGAGWRGSGGRGRGDDRRSFTNNTYPNNRQTWRNNNQIRGEIVPRDARSRQNPLDSRGQVSKCHTCGSLYHWTKDCLKQNQSGTTNKPFFTMYAQSSIQESPCSITL